MNIHKRRIEACVDLWGYILQHSNQLTRRKVARKLREIYHKYSVEPIRGKSKINIYDKELITVYLIGKYGLGLNEEIPKKIFHKEMKIEELIEEILRKNDDPRIILRKYFKKIDENLIFRILRFSLTKVLLGWEDEEKFRKLFEIIRKHFPRYSKKFNSFMKFYIALTIAYKILKGEVKNRIEKEALKHSLCIKFGAPKSAPSDDFIRELAVNVLGGEEYKVNSALNVQNPLELELKYNRRD